MNVQPSDPRQQAILQAAWSAFATYGFRKTSMDDIARGAGMSRPALYLHYRNKEDIFRSLVAHFYDVVAADLQSALGRDRPAADLIADAFAAQAGELTQAMLGSPHGLELLDAGSQTAADIVRAGEARLTAIYADWLARAAAAGRVRLTGPAEAVAATITAALKGIKTTTPDVASYRARVAQLAALIGRALTPED